MLILNEKKYVENLFETHEYEKNPYFDLRLVAIYLRTYEDMPDEDIYKFLISELRKYMQFEYCKRQEKWEAICRKLVETTKDRKLVEINEVPITRKEMESVRKINDFRAERFAFTLLVVAKYNHLVNPNNSGWVNYSDKIVFDLANIRCRASDRGAMYCQLLKCGFIELPKKNTLYNEKVSVIDDSNEDIVLTITDTRRLGMQYQNFVGDGKFVFCEKCGLIVKDGSRRPKKYCSKCAPVVDLQKAKERYVKNRFK